jgi:peptidoglycan hydrolase-like protein with peptidoglycan-binding domain
MRTIAIVAALFGAGALAVPIGLPVGLPVSVVQAAPGDAASPPSRYVSLPSPTRLLDTREAAAPVAPGGVVNIRVAGDAPLPSAASTRSVVLNVTVASPAGIGFWTVFPHGGNLPTASNLNVDERWAALGDGLAMANLVTVPIGADGTVDVYSQSGGHVVVDMLGSYETSGATASGRFQPLAVPSRIFDSRNFLPVEPTSVTELRVPAAGGASAAVLNVTTIANGPGYWTAFPAGTTPPNAANLNSLYPLHVVANQVIVALDGDGDFNVYSQAGGHLVVDLVGLMTGSAAPVSTDGLFVSLASPTRFLDTREASLSPLGSAQMPLPAWNLEVGASTNPAIARPDVAALVMNLTVTDALAGGYVTLGPAGTTNPADKQRSTSTLNVVRAVQTLPNHATVAVSARGFDVFTQSGGHLLADVSGFYLGSPVAAPFGPPSNATGTPFGCVGYPNRPVASAVIGSSSNTVARAQQRLLDLGFWNGGADGGYGLTTSQSVMAFQKWSGIAASGNVDETTAVALNRIQCRPSPGITSGDLFEVDKGKQLAFIIRGGRAVWVLNVSTGGNYDYTATDQKTGAKISDKAYTPVGTFRVYRVSDEPAYEGSLGTLYRPRFVIRGVAVHGYRSVPNYPASHGCIRVSNAAMDMIWATNSMPMGGTVIIHE